MMRKILLLTCMFFMATVTFAQDSTRTVSYERKNDILIDPISLIVGPVFNASYERILNEDFGIGLHTLLGLGTMDEIVQISPYARIYLGKEYAEGFFLETFLPITSKDEYQERDTFTGEPVEGSLATRKTSFGFGVGMGGKWILKKNIIFEIGGGIGRRLFYDNVADEVLVGKWMLGVGYKF